MTCKDCMHYDACLSRISFMMDYDDINDMFIKDIEKRCNQFKNKSKYIELPCEVGDKVYVICYKRNVQPYIRVETVLHMNYLQGKSLTLWQIHTEYAAHNAKDVIYSKSEAEQKLKELLGDN